MVYTVFKALIGTLSIWVISSGAFLRAECPIDTIIVNGHVENAPRKATVKVQLIYPKGRIGESGDVTFEDGSFRIPILFFTQSRAHAHFLNGSIPPDKCSRKPTTVLVSLIANDQEYDHVSLDMAKDFQKIELSTYELRSEILLHGPQETTPIQ
jgi:hypothetical protein